MQDSTHSILQSAKKFLTGTMLSRFTGLGRDIAMAYAFGTTPSVAAFLLAFRFSHLFRRLLGEGALQTAFVPAFEKIRKESSLRSSQFFRDLTIWLCALLSGIILITMLIIGGLLYWADLNPGNKEVAWLTLLMTPSLFFICLYGLNAGLLQCEKSYFTASFAPVGFNLIWILGVFFFRNLDPSHAMVGLSFFIIIACLVQWLVTVPKTLTILKNLGSSRPWQGLNIFSPDVSLVKGPLLLGIVGIGASQVNNALDSLFARFADQEGPALLWYAIRIQQLPLAMFGIAISGALLPPLSRAIKAGDLSQFRHFLNFALCRSTAPMIALTFAFVVGGDSVINLFYGHGQFQDESVRDTTVCLWAYGVGLIPLTWILIMAPALYSQGDYKTTTRASIVAMVLNLVLNALFIFGLGFGAASVAFATSISAWVNIVLLSTKLKESVGSLYTPDFKQSLGRVFLSSFVAALAVIAVDTIFFSHSTALQIFSGAIPNYSHLFSYQLTKVIAEIISFFAVLGLSGWAAKAHDLVFFKIKKESNS